MKATKPAAIDISLEEAESILKDLDNHIADEKVRDLIKAIIETFIYLKQVIDDKTTSLQRVLRMIFGTSTESSKNVLKDSSTPSEPSHPSEPEPKEPVKGHGRNGASSYTGAIKIAISHTILSVGMLCPSCSKGKLYRLRVPGQIVRFTANPPIDATVYDLEKLRCNLCGEIFTAQPPEDIGQDKYDEKAGAMIAILKYGSGFPFYRLEGLQRMLGIPLPAATQWEIVESVAIRIYPAFEELKHQGAQGDVIHNDDTTMKILDLQKKQEESLRKGMFTTAIVCATEHYQIALYFTGRNHAGENMAEVLKLRASDLGPPIQMCDALSRNLPKEFETILANCLAHGRRNFVDIVANFPEQCRYVIETLGKVYKNDELAKEQNLSSEERLKFHQTQSAPLMTELHIWLKEQIDNKKAEPNSSLGKAIAYMLKYWENLTRFLKVAGAPLDNNLCERALKKTVLNRKNSLFYKTNCGAYIGDLFMSLIHTCALMGINPFDYITELQKNSEEVFRNPTRWMPWNYQTTLAELPP